MTISISSAFDGGNIKIISQNDTVFELEIIKDNLSDFFQWFHFRVAGAAGQELTLKITNAGKSAFPAGWKDYQARVSEDRDYWFQTETDYDGKTLTIKYTPDGNNAWFAYWAPYSMEMHHDLVAWAANQPGVTQEELGLTLDGQPFDYLTFGDGPKQIWFTARQHPGEIMAEYWIEGALERLLDPEDSVGRLLQQKATFHVIPNMNPDGSRRGHLRTNAAGMNLNREWAEPSLEKSPEVLFARNKMDETGVDFAIDAHGDEAIPAVFIAGFEGIPNHIPAKQALYDKYRDILAARTPDFQTKLGYPVSPPGRANVTYATTQIAERFGAVAMTLEMPFKDNHELPDEDFGWSPERTKQLARDCMAVLAEMIDEI